MEQKALYDFLSKTNSELLSDFKWGTQGENDFSEFMNLVRKMHKEMFEIKKREVFPLPKPHNKNGVYRSGRR